MLWCIILREIKNNRLRKINIAWSHLLTVTHSVMSNSLMTPWDVACQAPLSMGCPRQEYWSGLPFPSPGDLPDPGIEPKSHALQANSLSSEPPGKPPSLICGIKINKYNKQNINTYIHIENNWMGDRIVRDERVWETGKED